MPVRMAASSPRGSPSDPKKCNDVFLFFLGILLVVLVHIWTSLGNESLFQTLSFDEEMDIPRKMEKAASSIVSGITTMAAEITSGGTITTTPTLPKNATTIAYAISLIQCSSINSNAAGLVDAALVLRHSVHNISVRNPASGSKYDYKMYAIVHRQAEACSDTIKRAGFEVIVVDPPIEPHESRGELVRKRLHRAFCCGHHEFIKLYAYSHLPEEIFVHTDIDFAFYKPMDNLFDAMLYDKDSPEGKLARSKIERERDTDEWPDKIEAFITRDWHQVAPSKFPPPYQAGLVIGRRDPSVVEDAIEVVREGNFNGTGWGFSAGWGGKGYGGFVGAMAMQGLMAYFYDYVRPNTAVELNQCRYNHMGLDIRYNKHPAFRPKWAPKGVGQCRNNNPEDICEDCQVTEMDKIYNVHYTQCRKPWACIAVGQPGGTKPGGKRGVDFAIDTNAVKVDHCMMLQNRWHAVRTDLEQKLFQLTGDATILNGRNGTYKEDIFMGHCSEDGAPGYIRLSGKEESYSRFHEIYGA